MWKIANVCNGDFLGSKESEKYDKIYVLLEKETLNDIFKMFKNNKPYIKFPFFQNLTKIKMDISICHCGGYCINYMYNGYYYDYNDC